MKIYFIRLQCGDAYTASLYNNILYFLDKNQCEYARIY